MFLPYLKSNLFVFLSLACFMVFGQEKDAMFVENIVKELKLSSKNKLPFGIKLETDTAKLKDKIDAEVFMEEDVYITYTVYFSSNKYDFGDISYVFEDGLVTGASIETYFVDQSTSENVFKDVKDALDKVYGAATFQENLFKWSYEKRAQTLDIELWMVDYEKDNGFILTYSSRNSEL